MHAFFFMKPGCITTLLWYAAKMLEGVMTRTKQKAMAVFLAIAMVFSMFASLPSAAQAETGETSSLTRCTEKGSGTKEDPYEISDAAQMSDLQTTVGGGETYAGTYFKLTKNLDLTESMTGPIGSGTKNCFSGTFDGNDNTLTVNIEGDSNGAGLFSCVTGGTVRNLAINGTVTGKYIVGAVAGTLSNATVRNVTVNAAVISTSNGYSGGVGGIAGRIASGGTSTIDHATMHGDVTLQQWPSYTSGVAEGGIAGLLQGTTILTNCKNTGTVSNDTSGKTTTAGKGGIVGKANAEASIEDCVNTGTVTGAEGSNATYLGAAASSVRQTMEIRSLIVSTAARFPAAMYSWAGLPAFSAAINSTLLL